MESRTFGRTGHQAKILTLGGCGLGFVDNQTQADKAMELAIEYGLNTIDIAPTYGKAEQYVGPWMKKHRDKFFIAEKTMKRTKKDAMAELKQSLKNLHSDKFELYQFHAVKDEQELNQILSKGGAYEAFKEAKETGLIDAIGLTCHADLQVVQKAIEQIEDLEVILIPVYLAAKVNPDPINDFKPVLKAAREHNIGVTAIKAIAKRRWIEEAKETKDYGTWYKPLADPEWIEKAVHYTLSQEGVTSYSLPCDIKLWPHVLKAGENFEPLTKEKQQKLIKKAKHEDFQPLFPE